tara:strand:- start:2 stop:445 length:444 start_codon:yes stop_codon:yes gene_type:complete
MSDLSVKQKRLARISTLQAIYALELKGSDPDTTYKHMLDKKDPPNDGALQYSKHLCNLMVAHLSDIDSLIKNRSKNWNFNRITLMDKILLRVAIAEMLYVHDVPPKVSITECVEIAKQFSTEDSSSFINGILDSVYNDIIINQEKMI